MWNADLWIEMPQKLVHHFTTYIISFYSFKNLNQTTMQPVSLQRVQIDYF